MSNTITISIEARLGSGISFATTRQFTVQAIDMVDVVVEHGASDLKVPIQPGGDVRLILLSSDSTGSDLTYKTSAAATTTHTLDEPQLLLGAGGSGMLEGRRPRTTLR